MILVYQICLNLITKGWKQEDGVFETSLDYLDLVSVKPRPEM